MNKTVSNSTKRAANQRLVNYFKNSIDENKDVNITTIKIDEEGKEIIAALIGNSDNNATRVEALLGSFTTLQGLIVENPTPEQQAQIRNEALNTGFAVADVVMSHPLLQNINDSFLKEDKNIGFFQASSELLNLLTPFTQTPKTSRRKRSIEPMNSEKTDKTANWLALFIEWLMGLLSQYIFEKDRTSFTFTLQSFHRQKQNLCSIQWK